MKVSGLCVLFLVVGTTFLFLNFSCSITGPFIIPEIVFAQHGDVIPMTTASRRLKENGYNLRPDKNRHVGNSVTLDDYHPIDPVPSSKASIQPGPIEHGTPLMPYIPRPLPPSPPINGGST